MGFDGRLLSGISVLAAVVEAGSFSKAAEVLGLSASGVSRAITRLEERLGVRLFDRTTRTLHLTDDGTRLYEKAVPHLEGVQNAASDVSDASGHVRGTVRVSVNTIFARYVLAPQLPRFKERHPGLDLLMVRQPDAGDLVADGIDVAVRFGPQPPSGMTSRLLLETRVITVASPAYLARYGRPETPAGLSAHDCIQYLNPQNSKPFEWVFQRGQEVQSVETKGRLTLSDADTLIQACLAGTGIAQALGLSVHDHIANGQLIDLFPDWPDETFPLYAMRPSRRLASGAVEAFLDFCREISSAEKGFRSSDRI